MAGCDRALPPAEQVARAPIDAGWPVIPDDAAFGQVSAVDVDGAGNVYVLHRAGRVWAEPFPDAPIADPTIFVFAPDGTLVKRWGAGQFIMPHGLSIDPEGKVWISDAGREQVLRFSPDGALELALGTRGQSGRDGRHFGRPADIAFLDGRVLVADGYVNTRIAEFDSAGAFIREWGDFHIAHAVAVDDARVYVTDRENARIQIFDHQGVLVESRASAEGNHPYAAKPLGDGRLAVLEGRDSAGRTRAILRIHAANGAVERALDLGLPGTNISLGHDLALGANGYVYATDVAAGRVVRFRIPLNTDKP